jgi:hypothetical protein
MTCELVTRFSRDAQAPIRRERAFPFSNVGAPTAGSDARVSR